MYQSALSQMVEALMNQDYALFLDLFSNLGAIGFIFWLTWRTTNYTIPRLAKSFEEAIKMNREDFKSSLQQERDDFKVILLQQRDDFKVILEQNKEFFSSQVANERSQLEKLTMALMTARNSGGVRSPIE